MRNDPALGAFDQLRVREVRAGYGHVVSALLAHFRSTAASLEPDERIRIDVDHMHESSMELLKAVLSDPHANKICSLVWRHEGKKDVNSIVPLLTNSCLELASLLVDFEHHSAFDFLSSVLEHPSNRIKELVLPRYTKGDIPRLLAALGQSQVSALALCYSPKLTQGLCEYLAKDLLVRLKMMMDRKQVPSETMMSLAKCARLAKLELVECEFSAFTHLPKSITTLILNSCTFVGGFDWADSNVREVSFLHVNHVDGNQFGDALAVHLRAKGLAELRLCDCDFVNETLVAVGVEIGRIKRLDLGFSNLNDTSIKLVALALQSPNNEMKELKLEYTGSMMSSIENHLTPALKHPNCNLVKLRLSFYEPEHREAAKRVEYKFRNRRALFVLLQGRQVKRRHGPLKRLPVEMLRLVGKVLI